MRWNSITRRHFLQGAGSLTLALPFLESIAPRGMAQAVADQKNLICFFKPHGSYIDDYFPYRTATGWKSLAGDIRELDLMSTQGSLSKVFAGEFDALKARTNIYIGLNPVLENHNGNIPFATSPDFPSIDQVVAKSSRYNKSGKGVIAVQGTHGYDDKPCSLVLNNGRVNAVKAVQDALVMFELLFSGANLPPQSPEEASAQFKRLVRERKALDRVLEDYKRLANSRQLSAADKNILDDYMDFVAQKQRQLAMIAEKGPDGLVSGNAIPAKPDRSVNDNPITMTDTMIEMMVAAIKTNICNTFSFQLGVSVDETRFALPDTGYRQAAFHQEISHSVGLRNDHTIVDRHLFSKVARAFKALDVPMSNGSNYADNTLMYVSADLGLMDDTSHHTSSNMVAVTLAGKNIPIRSGRCLSFANTPNPQNGYPHNQLLIGLMEAVGATDWKDVLKRDGLSNLGPGFGLYDRNRQLLISDQDKEKPLPYLT